MHTPHVHTHEHTSHPYIHATTVHKGKNFQAPVPTAGWLICFFCSCCCCCFLRFYLFIWQRDNEREREHKQGARERKKQAPSGAGSPMWGSIPEPWDHTLNQRQTLNDCATQAPLKFFLKKISKLNIKLGYTGAQYMFNTLNYNKTKKFLKS